MSKGHLLKKKKENTNSERHDCLYLALQIKSPPAFYTQTSRQLHRIWLNFDKTGLQMFVCFSCDQSTNTILVS